MNNVLLDSSFIVKLRSNDITRLVLIISIIIIIEKTYNMHECFLDSMSSKLLKEVY